jgi:DNA-binding response OmpR family regulator
VRLSEEFELFIHREKLLNLLQAHPLVLDLEQQRAFLRDQVVELTTNEFRFLECLIRYPPGGVATYAAIKGAIWRDDINPEDRSTKNVQELCARVRRNLGNDKDRIQSVETIGYRFIRDTR